MCVIYDASFVSDGTKWFMGKVNCSGNHGTGSVIVFVVIVFNFSICILLIPTVCLSSYLRTWNR